MGVLAVYDTIGIQDYIFSSNKLAENVGASKLVAGVFSEDYPYICKILPEVIRANNGLYDWKKRIDEALDLTSECEIIYQGGGNAYVRFRDEDIFQKVTKEFLLEVNRKARGVGIAVAAIETDFKDTYQKDFDDLNNRLSLTKGRFNIPVFAGNQPITKQSHRTGAPVTEFSADEGGTGEYISENQRLKRNAYKKYKEEGKIRIQSFKDLEFDKGEDSTIAIIHADGNNMGSRIKEYMKDSSTYDDAVPNIRRLATAIDNCYKTARDNTISDFKKAFKKYNEEYINKKYKSNDKTINKLKKRTPPIFELIGDGDDTTLLISGRFAMDFAIRLLREIEKQPDPFEKGQHPTACAGVVLFNSHYPFSEAYKLAEELCSSAKKPSRGEGNEGSYIDFHLHQSGAVSNLSQMRERQYKVDGQVIYYRPWRVTAGREEKFLNISKFEEMIEYINKKTDTDKSKADKVPRSKIKEIRNAISTGDIATERAINELRGVKLPTLDMSPEHSNDNVVSEYAALFDVLEMMDSYVNMKSYIETSYDMVNDTEASDE